MSTQTDHDGLVTGIGAGTLTGSGEQLPARTVRQLACDCDVIPYVLGSNAEVLDVGRASRLVTTPIRRALTVRDRGCVFPGCTVPPTRIDPHRTPKRNTYFHPR